MRCDLVDRSVAGWRNRAVNGFPGKKKLKCCLKCSIDCNDFAGGGSGGGPYM